jgi:hypothetical protein
MCFLAILVGILFAMPFLLVCCLMAYNVMVSIFCFPLPIAIVLTITTFLISLVCGIRSGLKSRAYQELKNEYKGGKCMNRKKLKSKLILKSLFKALSYAGIAFCIVYCILVNVFMWPSTTCLIASAISSIAVCVLLMRDEIDDINANLKKEEINGIGHIDIVKLSQAVSDKLLAAGTEEVDREALAANIKKQLSGIKDSDVERILDMIEENIDNAVEENQEK